MFKSHKSGTGFYSFFLAGCVGLLSVMPAVATSSKQQSPKPLASSSMAAKLPLLFEQNQGQAPADARFLARTANYQLLLTGDEVIWILRARPAGARAADSGSDALEPESTAVVRLKFPGMNPDPGIVGEQPVATKTSYLRGSDPLKWQRGIANYRSVRYKDIYPGIDLVFYGNRNRLEYDFVVAAGADPGQIGLKFEGIGGVQVDVQGQLVLATPLGELKHLAPRIFQETGGSQQAVVGSYRLRDDSTVGFDIASYDRSAPLTIDPVLVFSTYWGGSRGEIPGGVVVDSDGAIFLAGSTGSLDFPLHDPVQGKFAGGGNTLGDTFVTKFDPSGSSVIYSTYVGGAGTDIANGLAVDSQGRAVVAGTTFSGNFPSTAGAFQELCSGQCPFVFRLSPDGSEFSFSTFIGRGVGAGVAVDSMDQVAVTGSTTNSDFPVQNAAQPEHGGQRDAFVSKLNSAGSGLLFSTFLGGSGDENLIGKQDIATDPSGNIYVVGRTVSDDFPVQNAIQDTRQGDNDAFVAKYTPGGAVIYATLLGGSEDDEGQGIVADAEGNAYVAGDTLSPDFQTVNAFQENFGGSVFGDAFVAKIDATGDNLVFSTYLGGGSGDTANDIALDELGQPVVVGNASSNFPVRNPLRTFDGIDNYVAKFSADGSQLIYSTPIGGGDRDIVVGTFGTGVFVAGNVFGSYPILDALQPKNMGDADIFLTHIADEGTLYFAQFANGAEGGASAVSDLLLTGSSSVTTATATIIFRNSDGVPIDVNVEVTGDEGISLQQEDGLVVQVPPLGLVRITTDGAGELTAGSVTVEFDSPLGGIIRFTLNPFGTAGVGESKRVRGFITPVRRMAINTGVAVFNTEDRLIGLTLRLRNRAGVQIPGGLKATALEAFEHFAMFIDELFPNADLENFEGTLTVETSTPNALIVATALELGSMPGQFTTLPITPVP